MVNANIYIYIYIYLIPAKKGLYDVCDSTGIFVFQGEEVNKLGSMISHGHHILVSIFSGKLWTWRLEDSKILKYVITH